MDDKREDHSNPKAPPQRNGSKNNRTITCQAMMWKILTAQIREKIYYSLISCGIFPDEQKRWNKRIIGPDELLYIDQHILMESKTRPKNLDMA